MVISPLISVYVVVSCCSFALRREKERERIYSLLCSTPKWRMSLSVSDILWCMRWKRKKCFFNMATAEAPTWRRSSAVALLDRLRRGKQHHRERKLLRVANHEELELAFPPPLRPGSSALRLTQGLGFHFFFYLSSPLSSCG